MLGELQPRPAALQRLLLLHVCPTHLCGTVGQAVGQPLGLSSAHPCQVNQIPIHGCGLGIAVGCWEHSPHMSNIPSVPSPQSPQRHTHGAGPAAQHGPTPIYRYDR